MSSSPMNDLPMRRGLSAASCAVPLSVALGSAAVLLFAAPSWSDAPAQTPSGVAVTGSNARMPDTSPPKGPMSGTMEATRPVPVILTPWTDVDKGAGAGAEKDYHLRYKGHFACELRLSYIGYRSGTGTGTGAGHLYTPEFIKGSAGGMAGHCNAVVRGGGVVLRPQTDGSAGYLFIDGAVYTPPVAPFPPASVAPPDDQPPAR